ncbi:MAG: ornithine carbamoyltransferase [Pseudomonadota bacterium]|nr:ornithine carbamoyltransferase [Pseudomonadota bacterium]
MNAVRHLLTLLDFTADELRHLIDRGHALKAIHRKGEIYAPLKQRTLAMIFEKASTRTRVSFEAGMAQLGGTALFLAPRDMQLGRGEPIEDTARVLSSMVDCVMIRANEHAMVETFAQHSRVPVINALTELCHPCQLLADVMAYEERRGSIRGRTVAWLGDGNNVCQSYVNAAARFGFSLRIACPAGYEPDADLMGKAQADVEITVDPRAAAEGADLVVTDVWASMGQESEKAERAKIFGTYQVNAEIMSLAASDAVFMHCLPAHRGEEVTGDVIDGPQSVVWDEAENRLHAQKALLEFLIKPTD